MTFAFMVLKAQKIKNLQKRLYREKNNKLKIEAGAKVKLSLITKCRHAIGDMKRLIKKCFKRIFFFRENSWMYKTSMKLRREGTFENYIFKSIIGFIGGFFMIYLFFMFFVVILHWSLGAATLVCSIFGCICTVGLAFSQTVREIVLIMLPQLFSKRGRQALIAYAILLAITGPCENTVNNMGILTEALACGQEQLKQAVKLIIELIKKPFRAIKEAIKKIIHFLKKIVKKIKEIFLTIKRIVMAIVKVIKSAFQFLGKIFNICSKKIGTPFQRCSRVFENGVTDCYAKLGPMFDWLCSIVYVVKYVCYIVKPLDFICMLLDFINTSVIGVTIRKVKQFIRHIRSTFYVRIRFSHSFKFETAASRSLKEVSQAIMNDIKDRTKKLNEVFDIASSITSVFFFVIILKAVQYRHKFLTNERFDNKYITPNFRKIDFRRAKMDKECLLPLNARERSTYVDMTSIRLVAKEKKSLSKSFAKLSSTTIKLAWYIFIDYSLWWILDKIRFYGKYCNSFEVPRTVGVNIQGHGFVAKLFRGVARAFNPFGTTLKINTVPCLPDPIPPNYDKYFQIAFIVGLCWILAIFQPYGLRLRLYILNTYHPIRAKERAVWLYNHILKNRTSFLKFARRALKRKFTGRKYLNETQFTFKEMLQSRINNRCLRYLLKPCLGDEHQEACVLCATIFRPGDESPVRCSTPECPGIYCEQCFTDLQNICTICLDPIQYGDLTDVDEEKDSSDAEENLRMKGGKDLYSDSGNSSDYSYSYQYSKNLLDLQISVRSPFVDIERQHIPDYVSMDSFHNYLFKQDNEEVSEEKENKSEDLSEEIILERHPCFRKKPKHQKLENQIYSSTSDSDSDEETIFSRTNKSVNYLKSTKRKVKKWLEGKSMSYQRTKYQKDEIIPLMNLRQSDVESSDSEQPKSSTYSGSTTEQTQEKPNEIQDSFKDEIFTINYSTDMGSKLNYLFPNVRYEEISEEQPTTASDASCLHTNRTSTDSEMLLTHRKKYVSSRISFSNEMLLSFQNSSENSDKYKKKIQRYYKSIPRQTFLEESPRNADNKIVSFFSRLF